MKFSYPAFVPAAYRNPMTGIITIAVLAVVIYFIGKWQGWWAKGKPGADEVPLDGSQPGIGENFNARNEAVRLFGWLTSFDLSDSNRSLSAFNALLGYNDNQLRAVHNAWLKEYRSKSDFWGYIYGYNTLRKQVEAEEPLKKQMDLKKRIIDRLNALGL